MNCELLNLKQNLGLETKIPIYLNLYVLTISQKLLFLFVCKFCNTYIPERGRLSTTQEQKVFCRH